MVTNVFFVIGCTLTLVVFYLLAVAVLTSIRQLFADRNQLVLAEDLLHQKIKSASAFYKERSLMAEYTWNGFRKFEVKRKVPESEGVHSFYLYPHDGRKLPPFRPGQYLTFNLKVPGQTKNVVRCYSLSDGPSEEYYRVSIKKCLPPRDKPEAPSGLSSTYFNDVVQEGDILDVKAPSGAFYLDLHETTPVVLIGGGIGVTPVFSMLRAILNVQQQREVWFFLGIRHGKEHTYKEVLKEIQQTAANVHINICYSDPLPEDVEGSDFQHRERVSVELFKKVLPSNNYNFYICGPPPMMESLTTDLRAWGVPDDNVHFEAFGPATVKKAKKKDGDAPVTSGPDLTVGFSVAGKELKWTADAGTLLDLAEANDISIASGCRVGNCGTCVVAVKSGEFAYDTEPSFAPEAGTCLACQARPKSNLVIDA